MSVPVTASAQDQDPAFVRGAFASIAERYVLTNHVLSLGIDCLWRRRVARRVARESPSLVLDVATGSGDLAAAVQRACPGAHVVGVDFCPPMLDQARKRGLSDLLVADGMQLPFDEDSADVLTIAYGLRNMENWSGAAAEFFRVLRPGGLLVVLDFSLPAPALLRRPYRFYLHCILPRIAGRLAGNEAAYRYLGESIERFPSGEAMEALLEGAGFAEIETSPLAGGISSVYAARKA